MLTFIWLAVAFILVLVAIFAYSSRNKKGGPSQQITATDRAMDSDRKRAAGSGDD